MEIGERSRLTRTVVLTTAFKMDDALRIYVPVTMLEGFTMKDSAGVKGKAVLHELPALHGPHQRGD